MPFDPTALVKLVADSGVHHRQNAIAFIFTCPRCLKKDKLYIRKSDGKFVCWVCREVDNFHGHAEWALRELIDIPVREIQEKLYGEVPEEFSPFLDLELDDIWGDRYDEEIVLEPAPKSVAYPPDFYSFTDQRFAEGARYCLKRGIRIEHVVTYDIRYHPSTKRLIFPVKVDGQVIGWQARYTGKTEVTDALTGKTYTIPKVLTSDTLRGTGQRFVMFQDRLKDSAHCVLTEGPVDAVKAHLCGGNVAAMGKGVSERQLRTILDYGVRRIYFGLDRDAGLEVFRLLRMLPYGVEAYLLLPPAHRDDLGDCTQEEVFEQFKNASRLAADSFICSLGKDLVW